MVPQLVKSGRVRSCTNVACSDLEWHSPLISDLQDFTSHSRACGNPVRRREMDSCLRRNDSKRREAAVTYGGRLLNRLYVLGVAAFSASSAYK